MQLIIGLGNPEKKYEKTRHNVGFLAVDYIREAVNNFSKWQLKKKLKAEIAESKELNVLLAKPQTYMNSSGIAVKKIIENCKLPGLRSRSGCFGRVGKIENCTVVHDDFDLPLGTYKLEQRRGAAGHKGVQSIIDHLKTKEFWRLRIGIKPANLDPIIKAENFVLKKFSKEEEKIIKEVIPKAVEELKLLNSDEATS